MNAFCWHASAMRAGTSKSAASSLMTSIWRPLMPPWSLHHFEKTSAASNSSWFRPGRIVAPASENVATLMPSEVTPVSGAPSGLPFWQTSRNVPKSAEDLDAALDADVVELSERSADEPLRPQDVNANATTSPTAMMPSAGG